MYIEEYAKKQLFGSIDKNKIPANLTDYNCELIIEDYAQGRESSQLAYFRFTPKSGIAAQPFAVEIDALSPTKNLVYAYRVSEREEEGKFVLGQRQEFKMQTSIKLARKPISNLESIDQSEDEYYPDEDMEIRMLQLGDGDSSSDQSSSKCVEPSDGDKGRIKAELIQYLHVESNRNSKLKEVRAYLQERGFKIAQARVKSLLGEICKVSSDKKAGFILKDQYIEKDDYERKAPKKKVKEE